MNNFCRLDRIWKAQLGALQNPESNSQTLRAATPPSLSRDENRGIKEKRDNEEELEGKGVWIIVEDNIMEYES